MSQMKPLPVGFLRAPLVDKNGMASPEFLKWLQNLELKTGPTLTIAGEIHPGSTIQGRAGGLGPAIQNVDAGGVVLAAGVDFTRGYIGKHLGNVPDAPASGRAAWGTATQKAAAVDASGNLLLKNIMQSTPTTNSPTYGTNSFAVIPELGATFTTKGNAIFMFLTMDFFIANPPGKRAQFQFFRDAAAVGPLITVAPPNADRFPISFCFIDNPSAGSHTFDARWNAFDSQTLTADGLNRAFQAVELG